MCTDVQNYKWRLNPVWHRMLYSSPIWQQWASKDIQSSLAYNVGYLCSSYTQKQTLQSWCERMFLSVTIYHTLLATDTLITSTFIRFILVWAFVTLIKITNSLSQHLTAQWHIENSKNIKMVITLLQHVNCCKTIHFFQYYYLLQVKTLTCRWCSSENINRQQNVEDEWNEGDHG